MAKATWQKSRTEVQGEHADLATQAMFLLDQGAKLPSVDWTRQDLEDSSRVVTEASVRADYGSGRDDLDVFPWYLSLDLLPDPHLTEDHDEDPEMHGSYDWRGMSARAAMPPAKVWYDPSQPKGKRFSILDGNHRITLWTRAGMTHVPVWLIAEDGHRAAVKQALKDGRRVPSAVLLDYPDLAKYRRAPRR